jgi:hypothetical protein
MLIHVAASVVDLLLVGTNFTTAAREVVSQGIVIPALQRNTAGIKALIFHGNDSLVTLLTDNHTGVTPSEVILLPE